MAEGGWEGLLRREDESRSAFLVTSSLGAFVLASASTFSSFKATLQSSPVSHNQTPTFFIHPSSSSPENVVESMC